MFKEALAGKHGEVIRHALTLLRNRFATDANAEGFSRLTYELEPVGESVKLSLTHEMDRPDSTLIEKVSGGWPHILASLKSLLETGKPLVETSKWPDGIG